jgi:hypothetical protein
MVTTVELDEHPYWVVRTTLNAEDAALVRSIPRGLSAFNVVDLPDVNGWRWFSKGRGVLTGEGLRALLQHEGAPTEADQAQLRDAVQGAVEAAVREIRDVNRASWGRLI